MSLRAPGRALAALAVALLLTPLFAEAVPDGAATGRVGVTDASLWIGSRDAASGFVTPNDTHVLRLAFALGPGTNATAANVTARLTVDRPLAIERLGNATWNASLVPGAEASLETLVAIAADATGTLVFTLNVTSRELGADGAVVANATGDVTYAVEILAPVPPVPGYPPLVVASAAGAVVVVAGGGYYLYRRSRRQVRVAPRSRALREAAVETARPAEQAAIQEQVRAEEAQRVVRRETQILQAKKADVAKTIERLDQRREAGQLTELQHRRMREKKAAELAEIERQIAESENAG